MKRTLILFSVLLFTIFIQAGESRKCYFCHSSKDVNCEDLMNRNKVEVVECKEPESSCLRFDYTEADGFKVSDRRCIERRTDPCGLRAKVIEYLHGKIDACDVCDNDYCNGLDVSKTR